MRNDNQRLRVGIDASALDRGIPGRPFFKMSLSEGKCNGGKLHLSTRTISRMRSRTSVRRSCAAAAGNSVKDVLRGGMSPFRYLRTFCKYFRALVCHGSSTNLRSRALRYSAVNQMFLDRRSFASSNFFLVLDRRRYNDTQTSEELVSRLSLLVAIPACLPVFRAGGLL